MAAVLIVWAVPALAAVNETYNSAFDTCGPDSESVPSKTVAALRAFEWGWDGPGWNCVRRADDGTVVAEQRIAVAEVWTPVPWGVGPFLGFAALLPLALGWAAARNGGGQAGLRVALWTLAGVGCLLTLVLLFGS